MGFFVKANEKQVDIIIVQRNKNVGFFVKANEKQIGIILVQRNKNVGFFVKANEKQIDIILVQRKEETCSLCSLLLQLDLPSSVIIPLTS